ncbi:MAG: 3-methyl-2-oxobutanoate hydroxymethyltransferase [Phocaeicola sp.]|uniref:3-methyl-2-oxobutanoate hydroxymethyltransferase n=1 Tax=Phocaeicola sp. TaxID=2773926 RepID=UPI003F9F84B6
MTKNTILTFRKKKLEGKKLTMLTAYDYTMARIIDAGQVDAILVGDSLGNVMLGYADTVSVTMDDMVHHCAAVSRATSHALVVGDMPFMSFQTSVEEALRNAGRLMKEGRVNAVKLEGGHRVCPQIKAMVQAGIPVMAHLGLTPQSVNAIGGYRVAGRTKGKAELLLEESLAVQDAGAFSLVLECVPVRLASLIARRLDIPVIGIGSGNGCDGQVLVTQDMMGMSTDFTPKFVKVFALVGDAMRKAVADYVQAVESCEFPEEQHGFAVDDEAIEGLY